MGPDCAEVRRKAWGIDQSGGTVDAPWGVVSQPTHQQGVYPQGPALYDIGATAYCIKAVKLDARCDLEPEIPSGLVRILVTFRSDLP